jgi:hypothetical protein
MAEKLFYDDLLKRGSVPKMVVESYDLCLYQCFADTGEGERLVWQTPTKTLTTHNLTAMREKLAKLKPEAVFLRQSSAFDEMIGQPQKSSDNTLLLPLSLDSIFF